MNEPEQPEAIMTDCNVERLEDRVAKAIQQARDEIGATEQQRVAFAYAEAAARSVLTRISPCTDEDVERVGLAIEAARCKGREGPYGGYDYGYNPEFYGPPPEDGRYVIRDFRDPGSPDWGRWVHQTNDHDEHERVFEQMTRNHYARAAISAMNQIRSTDHE